MVRDVLDGRAALRMPRLPEIRADHRAALRRDHRGRSPATCPRPTRTDWVALKLLEGDAEMTRTMQAALPAGDLGGGARGAAPARRRHAGDRLRPLRVDRAHDARGGGRSPRIGQISLTERLDRWATHPVWGLFILAGILGLVFWLTFTVGAPLPGLAGYAWWCTAWQALAGSLLASAPAWLRGLVVDGVIGGAGSVLTFLPILVIFFATFGLLEDVGYMARAAYVMDNFMHLMGLHGKSFLPLFLGFGCNVPAIMGTRVIDSRPARLLTILIAPLVPCTARMAVVAFLAPGLLRRQCAVVSWGLVLLSLVAAGAERHGC